MRQIKVSKSVTLTMDNVVVMEQMMGKTRQNFSKTLNYVLSDWVKIRMALADKKAIKKDEIAVSKALDDVKKAKVIKE